MDVAAYLWYGYAQDAVTEWARLRRLADMKPSKTNRPKQTSSRRNFLKAGVAAGIGIPAVIGLWKRTADRTS